MSTQQNTAAQYHSTVRDGTFTLNSKPASAWQWNTGSDLRLRNLTNIIQNIQQFRQKLKL